MEIKAKGRHTVGWAGATGTLMGPADEECRQLTALLSRDTVEPATAAPPD